MEHDNGNVVIGDALERGTSRTADGIVFNVHHSGTLPVHVKSYFKSSSTSR